MGLRKNLRSNLLLMWEVVEAAADNSFLTRTLPPGQRLLKYPKLLANQFSVD